MIKLKCLDCPTIVDNREHGTGAKIRCNECQKIHRKIQNREYNSIHYIENTEYYKKYYQEHKESILSHQKKYNEENKEYILAWQKKYRESKRLKK